MKIAITEFCANTFMLENTNTLFLQKQSLAELNFTSYVCTHSSNLLQKSFSEKSKRKIQEICYLMIVPFATTSTLFSTFTSTSTSSTTCIYQLPKCCASRSLSRGSTRNSSSCKPTPSQHQINDFKKGKTNLQLQKYKF